jgi:maltodextrin utilization protein YvdJ
MTTKFTDSNNARLTGDMYSKKNKVTNTPAMSNINKWEQQINNSTNKIISNAKKSVIADAGKKIFSNISKTFE